jgi:hypothetical protein
VKRISTRRPFAWGTLPGLAAFLLICPQASFSQQPISNPAGPLHKVIPIGSHVVSVQGNNLVIVNGQGQQEDLLIDDGVSIWRGKDFSGVSLAAQLLQPGDEIKGRGRIDPVTQKLVATMILVNWTFISGTISTAPASVVFPPGSRAFEVTPGHEAAIRKIIYSSATEFIESAPEDMAQGSRIDVVGSVLKDGTVQAATVSVYTATGKPTRMDPNAIIISPTGPPTGPRK